MGQLKGKQGSELQLYMRAVAVCLSLLRTGVAVAQ